MFSKIRVKNFYSFSEEVVVDFSVNKKSTESGYDAHVSEYRLNKVIAILGPNGSGKTQLIKPLAFLRWFICDSFLGSKPEEKIEYEPHILHLDEDTEISVEFFINEILYRYDLIMNDYKVKSECLFARNEDTNIFNYIFKRVRKQDHFSFTQKSFGFSVKKAQELRSNASLISAAYSWDVKQAHFFYSYFDKIRSNVASTGKHYFESSQLFNAAERYNEEPKLLEQASTILSQFDLGLEKVTISKINTKNKKGEDELLFIPIGFHSTNAGQLFKLPFSNESSGTQAAFVLLERLLCVLNNGGIALIDELDSDLHPLMLPTILRMFRDKSQNKLNAQLFFTCHSPEILNRLQKHQIYLCEKDNQSSEAWRLDTVVGLRSDDNLYSKYMSGSLSGVPNV